MRAMPNIAAVLKTEISRIARKEMRSEIHSLKQAVSAQRAQIATLRKRAETAERLLRQLSKGAARSAPAKDADAAADPSAGGLRFSAKGFKSLRTKLALSANDMGLLLGATGQSVYNWENGKVRPHSKHLPAIAALRGLGKKEVAKQLEALQAQAQAN